MIKFSIFVRVVVAVLAGLSIFLVKDPKQLYNSLVGTGDEKEAQNLIRPHAGEQCRVITKEKKNVTTGIEIGVPLTSPKARIVMESAADRFYKRLGFSPGSQTGDPNFDSQVYIISNHSSVTNVLKEDTEARQLIYELLNQHYSEICTDGENLWLKSNTLHEPSIQDLDRLVQLKKYLLPLESEDSLTSSLQSSFRINMVKAAILSVAAYGCTGFIEAIAFDDTTLYLNWSGLFSKGLLAAGFIFFLLFFLSWLLLRRTAGGHRELTEVGIVLLLFIPFAGTQLVADLNVALDTSEVEVVAVVEKRTRKQETRTNDNSSGTYRRDRYGWELRYNDPSVKFIRSIKLDGPTFRKVKKGEEVTLITGKGWLGIPWLRSIEPNSAAHKD